MITLNNSNINFDSEDTSDESKYTISLSYKSSNFIFKTAGIERLKIMNNGNIGIGEFNTLTPPLSKLHICDNNPNLIIQDPRLVIHGDIYANRIDQIQQILPIEIGIDKIEKYIKFTYVGSDVYNKNISTYTFSTPTDLTVDILMVGGGGAGGDTYGGGGGAGGVVYIKNATLSSGSYRVYVGSGGNGLSSSLDDSTKTGGEISIDQNGEYCEIRKEGEETSLIIDGITLLAKGGGTGGTNSKANARDSTAGSSEVGRNGGSGGGSSGSGSEIDVSYIQYNAGISMQGRDTTTATQRNTFWDGSAYVVGGKAGRQNPAGTTPPSVRQQKFVVGGGGGGIGSQGNNSTYGHDGVAIDITGEPQIYAAGGGAGIHVKQGYTVDVGDNLMSYGLGGSGGIGGNGRIFDGSTSNYIRPASSGKENTGSGGGGSAYQIGTSPETFENAGSGGSGVVIIRYRPSRSTFASIELKRNTYSSNDNNTGYKIGNFDGGFKIKLSTSNIDIDRLIIDKYGDITVSRSINASNYLLNGQPFSILGEAKNTSNYIASTSNLLIEYINSKNQLNTSSQWKNNDNLVDIYYNGGKVGIGITNPTNNLHIYNTKSSITNLTIQSDVDLENLNTNTNLRPPEWQVMQHNTGISLNSEVNKYLGVSTSARGYDRLYNGYGFVYKSTGPYQNYVINTDQDYIVDILIVGAGGTATTETSQGVGGAGGAGGVVYIVDKKLDTGSYYITVGNYTLYNASTDGGNGEASSIKYYRNGTIGEIVTIDGIKLLGKGGGRGRNISDSTNVVGGIGSGGGGYYSGSTSTDTTKLIGIVQDQGNTFWNVNTNTYTAGGFNGKDAISSDMIGGFGGGFNDGNGQSINLFTAYHTSPSFGKGGIVYKDPYTVTVDGVTSVRSLDGLNNAGGGGSRDNTRNGVGGTGYVFIKYRKIPPAESSINLSIGNTKQLSYSISNTNNIFKINSGTSDLLVINSDGNANFKGKLTAKSYIIEGGGDILKDTSNYIVSTSNILTNYILTTSNLITNFINNKKSSQWNDRISSTDIYYDGNVGIGVTVGAGVYNPGPISKLTINDFISSFNHSIAPLTITNRTGPQTSTDPIDVLHLCRVGGADAYNTGMRATFRLGKSVAVTNASKTRLEIGLSEGAYNTSNIVMTILSNGKVGIGTTNPTTELHVQGTITAGTISATSLSLIGEGTFTGNINVDKATTGTLSMARGGTGASEADLTEGGILFTGLRGGASADSTKKIIKNTDLFYYINGTVSKVGVGTMPDVKSSKLNIGKNISDPVAFDYSKSPLTITNETNQNNVDSITPTDVLHLCRIATNIQVDAIRATFKLSKWSTDEDSKSNTRLDIALADTSYNDSKNVITFLSSGKIGIGSITSPSPDSPDPLKSINNKSSILNINDNIIDGTVANSFNYSEAPLTITNQTSTSVTANDLKDVLHLCRVGYRAPNVIGSTGARASFRLGMGDQSNGNSKTRLDIALADGAYKNTSITIMTILSSGNVGIGKTDPAVALDIVGSIKASTNLEISGNVGIGKAPHATYKLDVNGNINMPSGGILSAGGKAYVPELATAATSISSSSTSIVPITNGGTGASSFTNGRLLYANSSTSIGSTNLFWDNSKLAIGTDTLNANCSTLTINSIISGFDHNVAPLTITNQTGPQTSTDPIDVLHLCRVGTASGNNIIGMRATFRLGKYTGDTSGSRTRLDIALADGVYANASINVMTIQSDGKVGIGTTTPSQPLHVQTALRIGGGEPILEFGDNSTTQIVRNRTTSELRFRTTSADRITINSSGNVGIGITEPLQKLHVVGEIYSTSEITAYYSDERLKTKISTINNPLSIVNKLNGFYYIPNEIATKYGINKNKIEIGLSAQDVQKVLPELVKLAPFDVITNDDGEIISKSGEKYLTISYERIVPVLVEAIKELEIKNNCLNEKYENILQEISLIKNKINLNME